jgi:hypothetical protein
LSSHLCFFFDAGESDGASMLFLTLIYMSIGGGRRFTSYPFLTWAVRSFANGWAGRLVCYQSCDEITRKCHYYVIGNDEGIS